MEKADEIAWAVESCQDGGIAAKLVVDELLAQRATIERVRALLTTSPYISVSGPAGSAFSWNDETARGVQLATASWRDAIKKALGDE